VGSPVYALSDGYVYAAYKSLSGYRAGGASIVVYRNMYGKPFKALYGHIRGLKCKTGATGRRGGGTGLRRSLWRFMGHSYVRGRTYGWVDPLTFLGTASPLGTPIAAPPTEPTSTPQPAPDGSPLASLFR
jgi:hypothetical protein